MNQKIIKPSVAALVVLLGMATRAQSQTNAPASSTDPLMNALIKKGILTREEAAEVKAEMSQAQSNEFQQLPASKWKISEAIKTIGLFGDARLRYEYRSANESANYVPGGVNPRMTPRDRFRYSLRFGVKGELYDQFSYGVRLETSSNPRSPWSTFGDSANASTTPSSKANGTIYVGQVYLKWNPEKWVELEAGKMPMPLYTTPMVWDSDINPEGAFEKFNVDVGPANIFADFGQFVYENPATTTSASFFSGDVFLTAWQVGTTVKIDKDVNFEVAPVLYTYTGLGGTNGVPGLSGSYSYTGESLAGYNSTITANGQTLNISANQNGLNDLMVLEIPAEFNFKMAGTPLGNLHGRFFGDIAFNLQGSRRSYHAFKTAGLAKNYDEETKAYQIGFGFGSDGPTYGPTQGLVYGTTSRKNTWEARAYWQHVEQYSLDPNLLDSDYFEGRANLEGIYSAFAYSFTDAIIGTIRYGYAHRINKNLGTGGNNPDLPGLNPIENYSIAQFDVTLRF